MDPHFSLFAIEFLLFEFLVSLLIVEWAGKASQKQETATFEFPLFEGEWEQRPNWTGRGDIEKIICWGID